jgi:CDP-6-deoxy-D-xylo-4-hexulose-3-dehydrase
MIYSLTESTWGQEERNAAVGCINSGKLTMGFAVRQFEEDFARRVGSKYAVMCNSGSSANLLMLATLRYKSNPLPEGCEIIVPAVSWGTTYFPIHQNNYIMKIVDINKDTLNIDIDEIEKNITNNTKAIFAVNLLGNPCDFDRLSDICRKHNLILIEDNCESMFATYKNKHCGTFGLMGTYSCFFSHHISTIEGGIVVTDDEECYQYLKSLRAHGWTRDLPDKNFVENKKGVLSDDLYNFIIPGFNFRPSELNAVIGIEQLKKLDDFVVNRTKNHSYFVDSMKAFGDVMDIQQTQEHGKNSYFAFAVTYKNTLLGHRNKLIDFFKENDIESRPIVAGNFAKKSAISKMKHVICGNLPNANLIDTEGMYFGNHSTEIFDKIDYLADTLGKYIHAH